MIHMQHQFNATQLSMHLMRMRNPERTPPLTHTPVMADKITETRAWVCVNVFVCVLYNKFNLHIILNVRCCYCRLFRSDSQRICTVDVPRLLDLLIKSHSKQI